MWVPPARFARWVENFARDRTGLTWNTTPNQLSGRTDDGSQFTAELPFVDQLSLDPADPVPGFVDAAQTPPAWGVLLVRKGGFAIARMQGATLVEHKIGQRHVQGRTKAGGQSQQRFARRRDNQARQAYEAAGDHAARILGPLPAGVPLVTGGDDAAVQSALSQARVGPFRQIPLGGSIPDPRRKVLDDAIERSQQIRVSVTNA